MTDVDLRCDVCQATLIEAGALYRCRGCRVVVMCEHHVGRWVTVVEGLRLPLCAACPDVIEHPHLTPELRELIVKHLSEALARAWRRDHPGETVIGDTEPKP